MSRGQKTPPPVQRIPVRVISLAAEVTSQDVLEIIKMTVEWLKSNGICHYVLDLGEATHIQQLAIEALYARAQRLREYGGDIKIAAASEYLMKCFMLAGRRNDFRFYANQMVAAGACAKGGYG